MKLVCKILGMIVVLLSVPVTAYACDEFQSFAAADMKQARDVLINPEADGFDRLAAFQLLACSDQAAVRNFAVSAVLKSGTDPLLTHELLLTKLFEKSKVDIQMFPSADINEDAKKFIDRTGGTLSFVLYYKDRANACASIYKRNYEQCAPEYSIVGNGDKIEISYHYNMIFSGLFQIKSDGELIGFVSEKNNLNTSPIPAKLFLF